jgi:PIN domain nuclease of toxin-antitoxin system
VLAAKRLKRRMLLDTHVWIWLAVDEPRRLGARTRRRLARAVGPNAPFISTVSIFEIAALHTAGRLHFTLPVERWIQESVARAGFRVVPLAAGSAIDAGLIPAEALPDPLDRCLVAAARERQMPLVTCDARILAFAARSRLVSVVDASA